MAMFSAVASVISLAGNALILLDRQTILSHLAVYEVSVSGVADNSSPVTVRLLRSSTTTTTSTPAPLNTGTALSRYDTSVSYSAVGGSVIAVNALLHRDGKNLWLVLPAGAPIIMRAALTPVSLVVVPGLFTDYSAHLLFEEV